MAHKMGMDIYGVFKFLVVGLDVRRMNEDSLSVTKQNFCIGFICTVEDIIVVNMS